MWCRVCGTQMESGQDFIPDLHSFTFIKPLTISDFIDSICVVGNDIRACQRQHVLSFIDHKCHLEQEKNIFASNRFFPQIKICYLR